MCDDPSPCKDDEDCAFFEKGCKVLFYCTKEVEAPKAPKEAKATVTVAATTTTVIAATGGVQSSTGAVASGGGAAGAFLLFYGQSLAQMGTLEGNHVPESVTGFADAVSFANFYFGCFFRCDSDGSLDELLNAPGRRRLADELDHRPKTLKTGIEKFCQNVGVQPLFFMPNVLMAVAVFACACFVVSGVLHGAIHYVEHSESGNKWLKKIFNSALRRYVKQSLTAPTILIKVTYFTFYPVCVALLFQMHMYSQSSTQHPDYETARTLGIVGAILLTLLVLWAAMLVCCSYFPLPEKAPKSGMGQLLYTVRQTFKPATASLSHHFKKDYDLFWTLRLLYMLLNALIVTLILNPNPAQAVLLTLLSAALFAAMLIFRPYESKAVNFAACMYSFLAMANTGIFIVYAIDDQVLTREGYDTLGKIQIYVNMGVVFMFMLSELAKRWSKLKSMYKTSKRRLSKTFSRRNKRANSAKNVAPNEGGEAESAEGCENDTTTDLQVPDDDSNSEEDNPRLRPHVTSTIDF